MPRGENTKVFSLKTYRRPPPPPPPPIAMRTFMKTAQTHTHFPYFGRGMTIGKGSQLRAEHLCFPSFFLLFFADPRTLLSIFFLFFSFCMRVSMTRADANSLSSRREELRVDFFGQQEQSIMLLLLSSPLPVHWEWVTRGEEKRNAQEQVWFWMSGMMQFLEGKMQRRCETRKELEGKSFVLLFGVAFDSFLNWEAPSPPFLQVFEKKQGGGEQKPN